MAPTAPSPPPRPTMRHSTAAFLLPSPPPSSSSSSPSPAHDATASRSSSSTSHCPASRPSSGPAVTKREPPPTRRRRRSSSSSMFESSVSDSRARSLFSVRGGPGSAALRVCADGGANRVFDGMPELLPGQDPDEVRQRHKPDIIKGDMDSVRPEVKGYYSNLGTEIVDESHDQDTTDLHKCIAYIIDKSSPATDQPNLCILVLGALGGRFDHEMGNINVLHLFPNIKIVLLSDDCLISLLPRTHTHEIHIEQSIEGPHCGLIPIGMPSTGTTTTGLRWNLVNTSMRYGGLISTSNIVEEDEVKVTSDSDLIWTISLRV